MTDSRPRARDLNITIGALDTGPENAITDVAGVRVGHVTRIEGDSVRTGVTAILPHGRSLLTEKVVAAVHVINGYGKSLGLPQIVETGTIETPILLTSTLGVWRAADALVTWMAERNPGIISVNPVVGECNDGGLNDILARLIDVDDVFKALEIAEEGCVAEGNVGAGVGMTGFGWKGGVGTSSRRVNDITVGVLVLTNTGDASELRIDGFPVGRHMTPSTHSHAEPVLRVTEGPENDTDEQPNQGSIMMVLATDAPVTSRQLKRLCSRCTLGLGRIGGTAGHGSGDFVIGFTTASTVSEQWEIAVPEGGFISERHLSSLFAAAVDATEEAILNSMLKADTLTGRDGNSRTGIPIDSLRKLLRD